MAPHPTIIHAAADLRRQALLAEADKASRATPPGGKTTRLRREQAIRSTVDQVAGLFARIVDDFEPITGPLIGESNGRGRDRGAA